MLRRFTISLLTLALLCTTLLVGCKSSVSPYKRVDSFALGTFAQVTCRTELPKEELTRLIAEIDAEALALLVFTSGTTGKGKGVMLNQNAIISDMSAAIPYINFSTKSS